MAEQTQSNIAKAREEAIEKFGIEYAALAHRTGSVGPAEPIVAIHVSSKHRKKPSRRVHGS